MTAKIAPHVQPDGQGSLPPGTAAAQFATSMIHPAPSPGTTATTDARLGTPHDRPPTSNPEMVTTGTIGATATFAKTDTHEMPCP